jgi:hypothetical protein
MSIQRWTAVSTAAVIKRDQITKSLARCRRREHSPSLSYAATAPARSAAVRRLTIIVRVITDTCSKTHPSFPKLLRRVSQLRPT